MSKKGLAHFEEAHGGSKIAELERSLQAERKKVESLAGKTNQLFIETSDADDIVIGLIGCTHFGSLDCNESALSAYYKYLKSIGVGTVYHGGDVLDGHRVYRGQEFELRDVGLDAQLQRLSCFETFGIKTKFITGNHDQSFKSLSGVNVGAAIAAAGGEDYEFLGEEQARVVFQTPSGKYELMLIHPGGGSSYAISYRPQKIVESLEGGTKPHMLAIAHYHKADFIPSYRNVATLQTGTFQNQTPFMARQGLAAHVGGWVVRVRVGIGYNSVSAEFVAFYD
jgi:hypothetical protein